MLDKTSDDHVEMRSNGSSKSSHQVQGKIPKRKNKVIGRNYKLDRKNPLLLAIFEKVSKNEKVDQKRLKNFICTRYREGLGKWLARIMDVYFDNYSIPQRFENYC